MVLFTWKPLVPLLLSLFLFLYEDWISIPSCHVVPNTNHNEHDVVKDDSNNKMDDLKVMIVADLLLLGSDTNFFNLYFRDYHTSKFFKKAFHSLSPDMLLVLGDVSARGSKLTRSKWVSVLHQFHGMIGPFIELPFHVVLGDRDVGDCSELDANSVNWRARSFPDLDSSGCGGFEIGNISFVSLNAVALLCGDNKLRFSVEKAVEMERMGSWMEMEKELDDHGEFAKASDYFGKTENAASSVFGPVLLLHFPLHRPANSDCKEWKMVRKGPVPLQLGLTALEGRRGFTGAGPCELMRTVPPNATEYIFQALKPRIVFTAHTHAFCDHTHSDGTREITVPAMTWKARDDPGFVFVTFRSNGDAVSVSYCSLVRESHVLIAYASILLLLLTVWLMANKPYNRCSRR